MTVRKGKEPPTKLEWEEPRTTVRAQCGANHPSHRGGTHGTRVIHKGARATRGGVHDTRRNHEGARNAHMHHAEGWSNWALRTWQCGEAGGG